jgi:aspartyl-tRNA(Asn)/glutamyl-tRNA(Gln) amidotransferase subunit A
VTLRHTTHYARIHQINPRINAFCTLTEEPAQRMAKEAEAAVMGGDRLGALHGVPVSVKDVLLTPTLPVSAFEAGQPNPDGIPLPAGSLVPIPDWSPFTYPWNITGQPAASVPCGFTREGLPVGLQIVGRRFAAATVLRAAVAFEQARPWNEKRPSI